MYPRQAGVPGEGRRRGLLAGPTTTLAHRRHPEQKRGGRRQVRDAGEGGGKPRSRDGLHRPHRWQMLKAWGAAIGVLVRPEVCESSSRPAPVLLRRRRSYGQQGTIPEGGGGSCETTQHPQAVVPAYVGRLIQLIPPRAKANRLRRGQLVRLPERRRPAPPPPLVLHPRGTRRP